MMFCRKFYNIIKDFIAFSVNRCDVKKFGVLNRVKINIVFFNHSVSTAVCKNGSIALKTYKDYRKTGTNFFILNNMIVIRCSKAEPGPSFPDRR